LSNGGKSRAFLPRHIVLGEGLEILTDLLFPRLIGEEDKFKGEGGFVFEGAGSQVRGSNFPFPDSQLDIIRTGEIGRHRAMVSLVEPIFLRLG
jgi:hypothetical protein